MNQSEDRAAQLLRETFADAERLISDDRGSAAVRSPASRRTPVLLAAAAVLAIVAGGLYAANRGGTPAQPQPLSTVTSTTAVERETVQIYTAVITGVSDLDRPSAGWPKLIILDAPYEGAGGAMGTPRRGEPFSPAVRAGIEQAVRQIAPVSWVSDPADAVETRDGCAITKGGGSLIKVGPIKRVAGHVEVGVHTFQACLGAHWLTYRLDLVNGAWRITGTVGQQAIS